MNAVGDQAVFVIGPGIWRIESLSIYRPSISLSNTAKAGLFTGSAQGGTSIVAAQLVGCALGANNEMTVTSGVRNSVYTAVTTLYLYCSQALGAAATASFMLTLIDLTD